MGEVIAAAAYSAGRKVQDIRSRRAARGPRKPGHFVWIGIHEPDEHELRQLQSQFGLHELAIEDALNAHQRPKLEQYGETTFLVLRTAFWLGRAHRARRDRDLRRPGLHHLGPARRVRLLRPGAAVRRGGALAAGERRGLRRSTRSSTSSSTTTWPWSTTCAARSRRSRRRSSSRRWTRAKIARIYGLRRELQRLRLAVAPTAEVCRRLEHARPARDRPFLPALLPGHRRPREPGAGADRHLARDAGLRLRGRACSTEPGRGRARSAAGWRAGPRSWPCRRRSPASTA